MSREQHACKEKDNAAVRGHTHRGTSPMPPSKTKDKLHRKRANHRRLILLNKTRWYARQTMTKEKMKMKRGTSGSKTPTQGGAARAGGDRRKVKLIPASVVSFSKDTPSVILQAASDLPASLKGGHLQRLDESTRGSVRAPKHN